MSKEQRCAVIELYKSGKQGSDIIKILKYPKSTIYDAIKRYKELGSIEDRDRSGRPRT